MVYIALPQPAQARPRMPCLGLVAELLEGRREQRGHDLADPLELEVGAVGDRRAVVDAAASGVMVRTKVIVSLATTVEFSPRSANRSPGTCSMTR